MPIYEKENAFGYFDKYDQIAIVDADDSNGSRKETIADLVAAMAGSGLAAASGVLSADLSELSDASVASGDKFVFVDATDDRTIFSYLAICALHGRLDLIERGIDLGYPKDFDYRPLWLKLVRNQVRTRKIFNLFRDIFTTVDPFCKPHLIY